MFLGHFLFEWLFASYSHCFAKFLYLLFCVVILYYSLIEFIVQVVLSVLVAYIHTLYVCMYVSRYVHTYVCTYVCMIKLSTLSYLEIRMKDSHNINMDNSSIDRVEQSKLFKILFRKKLIAEWSQGMLAIIWCRILCLPVCYPKIQRLRYTEL